MSLLLRRHDASVGEVKANNIHNTACRGEGRISMPVHKTFRMSAILSNWKTIEGFRAVERARFLGVRQRR
jgi:hypothetical protein